jgi:hypothetical protein
MRQTIATKGRRAGLADTAELSISVIEEAEKPIREILLVA